LSFENLYKAPFLKLKEKIIDIPDAFEQVVLAEQFQVAFPMVTINPDECPINQNIMDSLQLSINCRISFLIKQYEPKDWFKEIVPLMSKVMDIIIADRTIDSTCHDCTPTAFNVGIMEVKDQTYYGGYIDLLVEVHV